MLLNLNSFSLSCIFIPFPFYSENAIAFTFWFTAFSQSSIPRRKHSGRKRESNFYFYKKHAWLHEGGWKVSTSQCSFQDNEGDALPGREKDVCRTSVVHRRAQCRPCTRRDKNFLCPKLILQCWAKEKQWGKKNIKSNKSWSIGWHSNTHT